MALDAEMVHPPVTGMFTDIFPEVPRGVIVLVLPVPDIVHP